MEYRRRTFRGAKIEDCILDFENMRKTAEKQSRSTTDQFKKRIYDGMAISYQTVVNRLVNDFDYKLESGSIDDLLHQWKSEFKRMATSCFEEAKKPFDLSKVPKEIENEMNLERQIGLLEGMGTGYKMIVSQLEMILGLGRDQVDIEDVLRLIKEQFTKKSDEFLEQLDQEENDFKIGFYSGINTAYKSAITHMEF